jgi:hypothetical protein
MYKFFTKISMIVGALLFIAKCFIDTPSNNLAPSSNARTSGKPQAPAAPVVVAQAPAPVVVDSTNVTAVSYFEEPIDEDAELAEEIAYGKEELDTAKELTEDELKKPFPEINFYHIVKAFQGIMGAYEELSEVASEAKNALNAFYKNYKQRKKQCKIKNSGKNSKEDLYEEDLPI